MIDMSVPELTDDERRENLERALAVRSERAQLRSSLKSGELTIAELLELADVGNKAASGMRVKMLISAMPSYGSAKTAELMQKLGISDGRRVGCLGKNQRQGLLDVFGGSADE